MASLRDPLWWGVVLGSIVLGVLGNLVTRKLEAYLKRRRERESGIRSMRGISQEAAIELMKQHPVLRKLIADDALFDVNESSANVATFVPVTLILAIGFGYALQNGLHPILIAAVALIIAVNALFIAVFLRVNKSATYRLRAVRAAELESLSEQEFAVLEDLRQHLRRMGTISSLVEPAQKPPDMARPAEDRVALP